MSENSIYMTVDGLRKLEAQIENLRTVKRPNILQHLITVSGCADWRESTEQFFAQDELDRVDAEIHRLEEMLAKAEQVEPDRDDMIVDIGETVVTPSLLNVEVTGPYGHDGAYTALESVVRHMSNPATAIANYDWGQLDPLIQTEEAAHNTRKALIHLKLQQVRGISNVVDTVLTDQQVEELVAFLHALTDPCVKDAACMAAWMPSHLDSEPDQLQLMSYQP